MNLKKALLSALKVLVPLGLGLYLVWYFYEQLVAEGAWDSFIDALSRANYGWVWLSLVVALISHMSRAYRWKYTLEPLNHTPKFYNSFFAVMIGYLINLAIPRLGEISRCGVMSRYEKVPVEKLFGTVIAERVADLIILVSITTITIFFQYPIIESLLGDILSKQSSGISAELVIGILVAGGLGGLALLIFIYRITSENAVIQTVQRVLKGIIDGITSIWKMKNKWAFIGHTLLIWGCYFLMFYLCFFALPETSNVPIGGVLAAFVLGGIAIAVTNGGIGAYPIAIQLILALYGVEKDAGGALGWIMWSAQTVLNLVAGGISFALIPRMNRNAAETSQA